MMTVTVGDGISRYVTVTVNGDGVSSRENVRRRPTSSPAKKRLSTDGRMQSSFICHCHVEACFVTVSHALMHHALSRYNKYD